MRKSLLTAAMMLAVGTAGAWEPPLTGYAIEGNGITSYSFSDGTTGYSINSPGLRSYTFQKPYTPNFAPPPIVPRDYRGMPLNTGRDYRGMPIQ